MGAYAGIWGVLLHYKWKQLEIDQPFETQLLWWHTVLNIASWGRDFILFVQRV